MTVNLPELENKLRDMLRYNYDDLDIEQTEMLNYYIGIVRTINELNLLYTELTSTLQSEIDTLIDIVY